MKKILSCAIRGRSEGDWHTTEHRQVLEVGDELANSITSVAKDSLVLEIYEQRSTNQAGVELDNEYNQGQSTEESRV